MLLEELHLVLARSVHFLLVHDVFLAPVDDADEPELEWDHLPQQRLPRIRSLVHEVDLGEDADSSAARGVDGLGELDGLRGGDVGVSGSDGEDDGVGVGDVLQDQVPNLHLDVLGLIADRNFGHAGEVDEGEVGDPWGGDTQADGGVRDGELLVDARDPRGLSLDLLADLLEVRELPARAMKKLSPLIAALGRRRSCRRPLPLPLVLQLEDKRTPGHDARPSREEVFADYALQHRALSAALTSYHHDLRQFDRLRPIRHD
mmetsp:Transcript_15375/g.51632  ORF Transcript_15375/g.51632 Transcript_15375/m.51632 type:complete len:260 (+) Transcript_15375:1356-2135(+)